MAHAALVGRQIGLQLVFPAPEQLETPSVPDHGVEGREEAQPVRRPSAGRPRAPLPAARTTTGCRPGHGHSGLWRALGPAAPRRPGAALRGRPRTLRYTTSRVGFQTDML